MSWTWLIHHCASVITAVLVGLAAIGLAPTLASATHTTLPVFVLEPDRGACDTLVTARGAGFPPGARLSLLSGQAGSHNLGEIVSTTVSGDGTFSRPLPFVGFDCTRTTPEGSQYTIAAVATPGGGRPGAADLTIRATYTITAHPARCFPETGYCVQGRLLQYWEGHGLDLGDPGISFRESLALFGYPISEEFSQPLEDGQLYTVQYFERARMEYHPEHWLPYDVLLGHFGRRFHPVDPPVQPAPGARSFPETGHTIVGRFLAFWEGNGGLAQFGYPLSEAFEERLEDGQTRTVQYFERARFEYHPEHAGTPYEVLLGHFGRRVLAEIRSGIVLGPTAVVSGNWSVVSAPGLSSRSSIPPGSTRHSASASAWCYG